VPKSGYREIDIHFEKGMDTQYEASLIPEGTAALLENWVPEEAGGLRVRQGWNKGTTTGGPSPAKGLGLNVFSATRRPKYLQKTSGSGTTAGDGTTTRILTLPWTNPTNAGNTLIAKVGVAINDTSTYWFVKDTGGYQWVSGLIGSADASGKDGFILVRENAPSESSLTIKFRVVNTTTEFRYVYELTEIPNVSTAAPKNLLSGAAAIGPIHRSDGIAGLNVIGWENDLNVTISHVVGEGPPPWFNTLGGTPSFGLPQWRYQVPSNLLTKFGTPGGTSGAPVTENTQYTASVYYDPDVSGLSYRLNLLWYNSSGSLISTTNGSLFSDTSNARRVLTATSPAGAAYAKLQIENTTTNPAAQTNLVSGAQLELGASATNWFFGSISCIDQINFGADETSPVALSAPASVHVLSLSEATYLDFGASAVPAATWSSYTETADVGLAGTPVIHLTSAWKRLTAAGTTQADSITLTNFPGTVSACVWALFNVKITGSAIDTDQLYVAAQDNASSLALWYIDQNDIDSGSWTLIENLTAVTDGLPMASASGLGVFFVTHPGLANPRVWPGIGTVTIVTTAESGVTAAFFKSRFYTGGSATNPTRLVYSDIGSYSSWPAANFLEIGQDDGYAILDIAAQQTYMVIVKGNSIYTLSGSGPDTFYLTQLPYGEAAPGRSICITPTGAVVAGKTAVWNVVSGTVEDISDKIGPSYGPTGRVETAYADGQAFITDIDAGVTWVWNLQSQAWHRETFTSVGNQINAVRGVNGARLLSSPVNSTDTGLIFYKDLPSLTRTRDFTPLTSSCRAVSPTIWAAGPGSTFTPRHLFLQIRQRGAVEGELVLKTRYDEAEPVVRPITKKLSSGAYRYRIDLGSVRGTSSIQFEVLGPSEGNQFDIEAARLGFDEEVNS